MPERIRFLRCKSGVGLLRRADTRLRSLQKPMLNKLSGNAYGSPAHTLAPQSLAPLPALHRTSTSPYHKIKPQSEFEARFCLAIVGKPTILKSGSQSAPRKPPLRSRFLVTHWRFYRTSPCIFRSAETEVAVLLCRARGGCLRRNKGGEKNSHPLEPPANRCFIAICLF